MATFIFEQSSDAINDTCVFVFVHFDDGYMVSIRELRIKQMRDLSSLCSCLL